MRYKLLIDYEMELDVVIDYIDLFILFVIYSFLGWVLETAYASFNEKKFVNRGFLTGCFCPIYGFGAVLTVETFKGINNYIQDDGLFTFVGICTAVVFVTVLEYITGFLLEKIFHCKWWDYSDNYANIKGYICLSYSLLWGVLVYVLIEAVNPVIMGFVTHVSQRIKLYIGAVLLCYFIGDTVKSIIDALGLRDVVLNYSKFSIPVYDKKIKQYKRFFFAFPRLMLLNMEIKNREIKYILTEKIDRMKNKVKEEIKNHQNFS